MGVEGEGLPSEGVRTVAEAEGSFSSSSTTARVSAVSSVVSPAAAARRGFSRAFRGWSWWWRRAGGAAGSHGARVSAGVGSSSAAWNATRGARRLRVSTGAVRSTTGRGSASGRSSKSAGESRAGAGWGRGAESVARGGGDRDAGGAPSAAHDPAPPRRDRRERRARSPDRASPVSGAQAAVVVGVKPPGRSEARVAVTRGSAATRRSRATPRASPRATSARLATIVSWSGRPSSSLASSSRARVVRRAV